MQLIHTISECRTARAKLGRVAFVPTMGALHAGHVSLIKRARELADHVVVSIFVNPTQFGPTEDFTRYPRPISADLEKCQLHGVGMVFNPEPAEIYPANSTDLVVDIPSLTTVLEGKHRPGHFKGVCQVVAKLFNIVRPDVACFGQKDFQQLRVLQAMTRALDFPIEIVACPTLRESDGLAMSSRNQYLSAEDRKRALCISGGLFAAQREFSKGVNQTNRLVATIQKIIIEQHVNIDYVAAVDPVTLKNVDVASASTILAVAARAGVTRLIDNVSAGY